MTAAALSATLLVGGGDPANEAPLLSGQAPAGSAAEVLRTAALMVEEAPVPAPRADQWIYVRERYYNVVREEKPAGLVRTPATIPGVQVTSAPDHLGRRVLAVSRAESGGPPGHVRE
ncbi:hypothetical protein [Streptomyces niveus]|uniref:hypothetical protein n=1 Tax=Streptomyces niveus TaxID=193462 RepID=UPI0036B72136